MKIDLTKLSTTKANVSFNDPTEKSGRRETFWDNETLEEFKIQKKSEQALFVDSHFSCVSKTEEGQAPVGVPNKTDMIFCFVASMEQCDEWHQQRRPNQRHKQLDRNRQCNSDHGKR